MTRAETGALPDFAELWQRQHRKLLARCLYWTGGRRDLAEEALARSGALALEKYPQHAASLRHPVAWLRQITYHVCIDLHREIKRRGEESLDELEEAAAAPRISTASPSDPERNALHRERRRVLRAGVAGLPPRLRLPLELHLDQDLSYREIADVLAITEANVRKRMQHAREALRDQMERYRAGTLDARVTVAVGGAGSGQDRPVARPESPRASDRRMAPPPTTPASLESQMAVRAFRAIPLQPAGRIEKDFVLVLREPVRRASDRRFESLRAYIESHPGGWKRRRDLARLLRQEGRWAEAIGHYRFVLDKNPRQAWLWAELAEMLEAMGQIGQALEAYGHARQRSRTKAERRRWRAAMLAAGGDLPEAAEALRDALFISPGSPLLHLELGRLLLRSERFAEADQAFEQALLKLPDDPEALVLSHDARYAAACRDQSVARVRRVVERWPESFPALARWLVHEALGELSADREEVRRHRGSLRRLAPDWAEARYAEALQVETAARREGGEGGRGIAEMEAWLESRSHHPRGHLLLARLLEQLGKPEAADRARRRARGAGASDRGLVWP